MLETSELILNDDGSIYHLALRPDEIAPTIITVGDPNRVAMISKYFDHVEVIREKREFVTHTGRLGKKQLTVISTGIGTDNVDIVVQELDALANIDLTNRQVKPDLQKLSFIRLGTSGGAHESVPVDSIVSSQYGIGLDGLMAFYPKTKQERNLALEVDELLSHSGIDQLKAYAYSSDPFIALADGFQEGMTLTCTGFYGPQGRSLRLNPLWNEGLWSSIQEYHYQGCAITNIEMETAGIFALCRELGHQCMSVNAILANRVHRTFSSEPRKTVERMIRQVLEILVDADDV